MPSHLHPLGLRPPPLAERALEQTTRTILQDPSASPALLGRGLCPLSATGAESHLSCVELSIIV